MCMLYLFANADRFSLPTCCKGMIRGLEHEHVISAVQTEFASCKPNSNENWLCLDRISTNSTPCQTRFTKCNMYRRCPTAAAWLVMCRLGYSNFTCSIRTATKYEIGSLLSFLGWPGWACQFVLKPQTPVIVDSVRDFEHLSSQFLAFAFAIGEVRAG